MQPLFKKDFSLVPASCVCVCHEQNQLYQNVVKIVKVWLYLLSVHGPAFATCTLTVGCRPTCTLWTEW